MTQNTENTAALLPSGLFDLMGADADGEIALVSQLTAHFRACGYARVQPPLMEFASSLLIGGDDSPLAKRSFRLMDPISGQMLALRADMTMQIARIAGSSLKAAPRPLRLCYAGQTLCTLPDTLRQSRQFRQMGIELFGSDAIEADVEVMQIAAASLMALGITDLSLDISLPQLLPELLLEIDPAQHSALLEAIRHKDSGQLEQAGQPLLAQLCRIACDAKSAFTLLHALDLPPSARAMVQQAQKATELLTQRFSDDGKLKLLLDPLEMRGFGYHSGLSFALYAKGRPYELGRGGRYLTPHGETATGFTFYAEDILPLLQAPAELPLLALPAHCSEQIAAQWRAKGYRTAYALTDQKIQADYTLSNTLTEIMKAE